MDIQDLPRRSPGAIVSSQMHFIFSFRNVLAVSRAKNFVCMTGVRLGPHYRLFIGRQFSWLLNKYEDLAIVVGRQIDRKIVGIPFQQESWPTIDRAWCTMRVRTFTDYPVGDSPILCVQWLSAVQKF
jgi:hypothetical protein